MRWTEKGCVAFDPTPYPRQMESPQFHHWPAGQKTQARGGRLGRSVGEVALLHSGSKRQEVLPEVRSLEKLAAEAGPQYWSAVPSNNSCYFQGHWFRQMVCVEKERQPDLSVA